MGVGKRHLGDNRQTYRFLISIVLIRRWTLNNRMNALP